MKACLLLLQACFIGGSSVDVARGDLPAAFDARNAQACAREAAVVPVASFAEFGATDGTASFSSDTTEFEVPATASGDFIVATLPGDLTPGTLQIRVKRSIDGIVSHNDATLQITTEGIACTTLYAPVPVATGGARQISLSWAATPAGDSYSVLRSARAGDPFVEIGTTPEPTFVDHFVADGATINYKVAALSALGRFESKVVQSAAIPPRVAAIAAASGVGKVDLTWEAALGAKQYALERSIDERTFTRVGTSSTLLFSDTTPPTALPLLYRVVAINDAGESVPSTSATAVSQSGRVLYACQRGTTAATTGVFAFDADAEGNTRPIWNSAFDATFLGSPPIDADSSGDGVVWFSSPTSLTGYSALGNTLNLVTSFALRELNGDARSLRRAGARFVYDAVNDAFLFAGAADVSSAQSLLYSVPRLLLREPSALRERSLMLTHSARAVAVNALDREIYIADTTGTATIHVYSLDDLDAPEKRGIFGPLTQLNTPTHMSYDPVRNAIVVLDSGHILRFAANASGNAAPTWQAAADAESLAVDTSSGDVFAVANDQILHWTSDAPTGAIALPTALQGVTGTQLAFDPISQRPWVSGLKNGNVVAMALPDAIVAANDIAQRANFDATCAVEPVSLRTVTLNAALSTFGLSFFIARPGRGPQPANGAWSALNLNRSGVLSTTPARTFAYRGNAHRILLAGTARLTSGVTYQDFVAEVADDASGPTVTAADSWMSDTVPGNSGEMKLSLDGDDVLLWRGRGPSGISGAIFVALPADALDGSTPQASGVDSAATACVALVHDKTARKIYFLHDGEVRVYDRFGTDIVLNTSIVLENAALAGAQGLALDGGRLRIALSSGEIVAVPVTASGTVAPVGSLRGTRTLLLPTTFSIFGAR